MRSHVHIGNRQNKQRYVSTIFKLMFLFTDIEPTSYNFSDCVEVTLAYYIFNRKHKEERFKSEYPADL